MTKTKDYIKQILSIRRRHDVWTFENIEGRMESTSLACLILVMTENHYDILLPDWIFNTLEWIEDKLMK